MQRQCHRRYIPARRFSPIPISSRPPSSLVSFFLSFLKHTENLQRQTARYQSQHLPTHTSTIPHSPSLTNSLLTTTIKHVFPTSKSLGPSNRQPTPPHPRTGRSQALPNPFSTPPKTPSMLDKVPIARRRRLHRRQSSSHHPTQWWHWWPEEKTEVEEWREESEIDE